MVCRLADFYDDMCLSSIDGTAWGCLAEVVVFLYAFGGLAISADHMVNSMETICDHWSIPEDVGGATLMAFGSAVPEITVNAFSTLRAVGTETERQLASPADLGVGAILGSGMIAFLVIPAVSAVFAPDGAGLKLRSLPLLRDSTCYAMALSLLISAICDGGPSFMCAINLIAVYGFFMTLLVVAQPLQRWLKGFGSHRHQEVASRCGGSNCFRERYNPSDMGGSQAAMAELLSSASSDSSCCWEEDCTSSLEAPEALLEDSKRVPYARLEESVEAITAGALLGARLAAVPSQALRVFFWPAKKACDLTCPDCRILQPLEHWYPITFLASFMWITLYSGVVTVIANRFVALLNNSSAMGFLGLAIVAIGAEIPDTVNAVTVARRGYGAMSTSSCIGSQVVNICIGLGLPWAISTGLGNGVPLGGRDGFVKVASFALLAIVCFVVLTMLRVLPRATVTLGKAALFCAVYGSVLAAFGVATIAGVFTPHGQPGEDG